MKKYIILSGILLSGCAVMDVLVGSQDGTVTGIIPEASKLLTASDNPSYVLAGTLVTMLGGMLKWIAWKRSFGEVVTSFEEGLNSLPDKERKVLLDTVSKRMNGPVKKLVKAVKINL